MTSSMTDVLQLRHPKQQQETQTRRENSVSATHFTVAQVNDYSVSLKVIYLGNNEKQYNNNQQKVI